MPDTSVQKLSPRRLNRAMRLNIVTGGLATVWNIVCSPQPIFNVFVRNSLGASASTLGALVALIQLSGLFQLVSIFIYGYSKRKKPFFIAAHLVHRLLTLAIAAAAFVAAAGGNKSWGIRAIMIAVPLSWVFMNASSAGWWSWVADLFPENIRGSFFLRRSAIINIVNVVWFFLASMLLDIFDGPASFWIYGFIFSVGAVSGILDIILNMFIPEPAQLDGDPFVVKDAMAPLRNRNFIQFSVATGIAIFSINLISPFQSPYVVDPDRVAAPNTWLGIMFVISQLTWVLTAPFWGTVMDKWGRKPVVVMGCMFTLSWTGYFFLSPRSYIYLLPLISIGTGLLAPAFWEGINQMMLSLAPSRNRIAFVAWYMTIVGVVSAGGSLCGGFLLDHLTSFSASIGPMQVNNFHVVQLLAILMVILSALIISRVREGRERTISFVVGRIANPGILKTYAYLDDIATACHPGRTEQALRSIERQTGDLALEEIIARLDDPYPEIREEAARALGRIASPLALEHLTSCLEDRSSSLRIAAARALGKIRDERAVPALELALDESDSEEMSEACVQALGDIGGDEAADIIIRFYRSTKSDRLRASAADAAGRTGQFEAAQDILPRLIKGKRSGIRRQYAIALGNLFGPPGAFYRYVSGSESGINDRIGKLFNRLESKTKPVKFKLSHRDKNRSSRERAEHAAAVLSSVREAMDNDLEEQALAELCAYARSIFTDIFGEEHDPDKLQALAFRVDQRLGAFAWFLNELDRYLAGLHASEVPVYENSQQDVQRLMVLLIAFFLDSI